VNCVWDNFCLFTESTLNIALARRLFWATEGNLKFCFLGEMAFERRDLENHEIKQLLCYNEISSRFVSVVDSKSRIKTDN
jgi:hypothetical protein